MSSEECAQLLKTLGNPARVECYTNGGKLILMVNVDGLSLDEALKLLGDVRSKVPKQYGKSIRLYTSGVFTL